MNKTAIAAILVVQITCGIAFVGQILLSGAYASPTSWGLQQWIAIAAAFGLLLGILLGSTMLKDSFARSEAAEGRLAELSGAFMDLIEKQFTDWGLTPAERDVAFFLVKGLSAGEIAGFRTTSEGTVKAQSNAIYRKAGVSNRAQLVSFFIEDLLRDELRGAPE